MLRSDLSRMSRCLLGMLCALVVSSCCHVNNLNAHLPTTERVLVDP